LDLVTKRKPDLILKFGGHAMAAGCTIKADGLAEFRTTFCEIAKEMLTAEMLDRVVLTDGPLGVDECSVATAKDLAQQVWGQGFDQPLFVDKVKILNQRLISEKHLKLTMTIDGQAREGIWFGRNQELQEDTTLAYRIAVNSWQGRENVQMIVEGEIPA
jgi:single-stranded-DNA-specific exonuclease